MLASRRAASYSRRGGADGHPTAGRVLWATAPLLISIPRNFAPPPLGYLCGFVDATIAVELPARTLSGRNWF